MCLMHLPNLYIVRLSHSCTERRVFFSCVYARASVSKICKTATDAAELANVFFKKNRMSQELKQVSTLEGPSEERRCSNPLSSPTAIRLHMGSRDSSSVSK